MFEQVFKLSENKTNVRTEIVAGVRLPDHGLHHLRQSGDLAEAKMPFGAVFAHDLHGRCHRLLPDGLLANYPIALAPGAGLNTTSPWVVGGMGYTGRSLTGCVFISGVIFFIISVLPIREWIVNASQVAQMASPPVSACSGADRARERGIVVGNQATLVPATSPASRRPGDAGLRADRGARISPHHGRCIISIFWRDDRRDRRRNEIRRIFDIPPRSPRSFCRWIN